MIPEWLQETVGGPGGQEMQGQLTVQHGLAQVQMKGQESLSLYTSPGEEFLPPGENGSLCFLFFFFCGPRSPDPNKWISIRLKD